MKYHKIKTVWNRDPKNNYKTLIDGSWSKPEFEYLADNGWHLTEKIDGTNIRIIWEDGDITFAGRTDNAQIPAPLTNYLYKTFLPLESYFRECFPDGIILYGEGYGGKIQGMSNLYGKDQRFILFDIYDPDNGIWFCQEAVVAYAADMGIEVVPHIGVYSLYEAIDIVRNGLLSKFGLNDCIEAEGIVARPLVEMFNNRGERIITKIKHKDFAKVGVDA